MARELAALHAQDPERAAAVRFDLDRREPGWLGPPVARTARATEDDWKDYRR
jgi:hypothetical protein